MNKPRPLFERYEQLADLTDEEYSALKARFNKAMIAQAAIQATKALAPNISIRCVSEGVYFVTNEKTGYSSHIGADNRDAALSQFLKLEKGSK